MMLNYQILFDDRLGLVIHSILTFLVIIIKIIFLIKKPNFLTIGMISDQSLYYNNNFATFKRT